MSAESTLIAEISEWLTTIYDHVADDTELILQKSGSLYERGKRTRNKFNNIYEVCVSLNNIYCKPTNAYNQMFHREDYIVRLILLPSTAIYLLRCKLAGTMVIDARFPQP